MPLFVYMTAPDESVAERLSRHLLERKLAACVNILPSARSLYWWEGRIQDEQETVMIAKTTQDRFDALLQAVCDEHPYECPCVVALTMAGGNPAFIKWIEKSTRPE